MAKKPSAKKNKKQLVIDKKKLRSIKRHSFAGNSYNISWVKPSPTVDDKGNKVEVYGLCEEPKTEDKKITISPHLSEEEFLKTCIDEAIHACNWSLDNEAVDDMSESIGSFLYRIGFRLNHRH